ncbi:MAG: CDP-2,3-bis-(O-geranylgeranyl)-sn-glycerol synthase [Thermoplasmatales archaeon]|nr:MAG: CDP-2,3-bis-(O-geranylgeranyl)-sn-glycerol synthase [Thermoplasmatales archaeon]
MEYEVILQAFWLIIPAYIANASAVLVGGGTPVDFGKNWKDGKRILGDGKTWRGLFAGAFIGMIGGFGLAVAARYIALSDFAFLNLSDFEGFPLMIPIIFSLCFGALTGDVVKSFFKRRIGKNRGEGWFLFDQIDFIVGAFFFSFLVSGILQVSGLMSNNWFYESFTLWHILFLIVITPFIHLTANFLHKKSHTINAKR